MHGMQARGFSFLQGEDLHPMHADRTGSHVQLLWPYEKIMNNVFNVDSFRRTRKELREAIMLPLSSWVMRVGPGF
jgi:hypothetical protein